MYTKIFRNSSYLILAQSFARVLSFIYGIFLARSLGVADFGTYTVALSYLSLVSAVSDFGISRFLLRELSRGDEKYSISSLFSNAVFLRLYLTSIFFGFAALLLNFLDPDKFRVNLTLLAILAVLPQSVALTLDSVLISRGKFLFSSIGLILLNLMTILGGVYFVNNGSGAIGAMWAILAGQIVYMVFLFLFLTRKQNLFSRINSKLLKEIAVGSLPYGLLGVLGLVYFRIDSILISYLRNSQETGFYGAAYKFIEAVVFIPTSFGLVLFPIFSKMHDIGESNFKRIYFKSIFLMAFLGTLIAISFYLLLPQFINMFLPAYTGSISALRILCWAIPFMFVHIPASQVLLSTDRFLKPVLFISIFNMLFNVILNLIFIPKFGYIGASWVTVFSDVFSLITLLVITRYLLFSRHG